jgi:phosphatidylethanolamine-binding protein (PEBP) family uncharacterized protein
MLRRAAICRGASREQTVYIGQSGIGDVGYIGLCPPRQRRVRPALTEASLS